MSMRSGQPGINAEEYKTLPIFLPSFPEQTKIASFLTAVDEKLTQLKKKKTLLEQYKKGIMQKLFSQELRFKDNNNQDFPDWQEKIVENIFKITRGNVLSMTLVMENQDAKNRYPVYSSQTRNKGLSGYYDKFLFENCITWTTDGAGAGDVNFRKGKFCNKTDVFCLSSIMERDNPNFSANRNYTMSASPMLCNFNKLVWPHNATGAPSAMITTSPGAANSRNCNCSSACNNISSVLRVLST